MQNATSKNSITKNKATADIGLQTVSKLFQTLNQQNIRYCHWKSNLRLAQDMQGEVDLDLLVDRKHKTPFKQILYQYKLKLILAPPSKRYPAVENYLGFDPQSGKMFHLHVHYQLILGEQFVKNYRLPIEAYLLDSVQLKHGVKIPTPDLEIIILAMRSLLKYRDRDVIKDVLNIRHPGIPKHIRHEIELLLKQSSIEQVTDTLKQMHDILPADVILQFLQTYNQNQRAGSEFYQLRRKLRAALNRYQRYNRLQAMALYFYEFWQRKKPFRLSPRPKMTLFNVGITIALIGADGAGKSTSGKLLIDWLSKHFDVHTFYLGSTQPSRRSAWLYIVFRMFRRTQQTIANVIGEKNIFAKWLAGLRDTMFYLNRLSIAYDRYFRYKKSKKKAMAGSVVIHDRHPMEFLSSRMNNRPLNILDGAEIRAKVEGEMGFMTRILSNIEQNVYHKISPPDYVCVLDVSPDVSLKRKPDHKRPDVEAKSQAIKELVAVANADNRRFNLIYIDADRPFEEVIAKLKADIWEVL